MQVGEQVEIVDVDASNVDETRFFCMRSKPKAPGYRRKRDWLEARFAEGMRMKIIRKGGRGFIEYIPGQHAWRAVHADGRLVDCRPLNRRELLKRPGVPC